MCKKCLSPPTMSKLFVPPPCVSKIFVPPPYVKIVCPPPLTCVGKMFVPRGTNKLFVPRGQTKGDTLTHSLTNEALYIYRWCYSGRGIAVCHNTVVGGVSSCMLARHSCLYMLAWYTVTLLLSAAVVLVLAGAEMRVCWGAV